MRPQRISGSRYKGVSRVKRKDGKEWLMSFMYNNIRCAGLYDTEREAALRYDLKQIELGNKPVNILKAK